MSGAAELVVAIGLAASISQLVDYTNRVIYRIRQIKQGSAFEDVLSQLDLFLHDVLKVSNFINLKKNEDDEASRTFSRVLGGCTRQMIILNDIIASVTPSKSSSTLRRTWVGLKSIGKDAKVREIMAILDRYRATLTLHMVSDLSYPQIAPPATDINSKREECILEVPRRRVAYFVGRKGLLKNLREFVLCETKASVSGERDMARGFLPPSRIAVLVGLGGQGKTQIALEACRQCRSCFGTIIWINASSRDSALSDVKRTVRRFSPGFESSNDAPTILTFFHQWLRNLIKPWMLVFDNYDDPVRFPDIASFYPEYGSIIITSRHSSSRRLGVAFEIGALTDEEGRDLLLRGRQQGLEDSSFLAEATDIVNKLGNLALAIDQAASYISTLHISLQTFAEVFESRKKAILDHTPATWEYRAQAENGQALSAFTTWELSINQIGSNEKQRESITEFLTLLAFLDAASVKESLFSTYVEERSRSEQNQSFGIFLNEGKWDSAVFQDLVMELVELALIQHVDYDEGYLLISLHPIIKDWLQLRINHQKQEMMVQDCIDIIALFITKNDAVDLPYRLRSALLRHIDVAQLNVGRFLKTEKSKLAHGGYLQGQQAVFATFYGKHDRASEAEALFKTVLSQQTHFWGPMDIAPLATTNNLASLYLRLRRFEEAEVLLRRVLRGKEAQFSPSDIRVANTVNELGNVCSQLGRCEEARTLYLRNLDNLLKNQNTSVNNLKIVYNNLGEVALRQGDLIEAGNMFEKALEQGRNGQPTCLVTHQTCGEGPLDEIDCQILMNKGRLLNCVGMFELAHETYKRASQGLVVLLGPKHSKVAAAEKELLLINPSRTPKISLQEMEELRCSQNCDKNPSIQGQCINWGSTMQMQQSQLLQLEHKRINQQGTQSQMSLFNSRPDGVLRGSLMPSLMSQSPPLSHPGQDSSAIPPLQMWQSTHPFISANKPMSQSPSTSHPDQDLSTIHPLQMMNGAHPFIRNQNYAHNGSNKGPSRITYGKT